MIGKKRLNVYVSDSNSDSLTRIKRYCKIDKGAIVDKALTKYFSELGKDLKLLKAISIEFGANDQFTMQWQCTALSGTTQRCLMAPCGVFESAVPAYFLVVNPLA